MRSQRVTTADAPSQTRASPAKRQSANQKPRKHGVRIDLTTSTTRIYMNGAVRIVIGPSNMLCSAETSGRNRAPTTFFGAISAVQSNDTLLINVTNIYSPWNTSQSLA